MLRIWHYMNPKEACIFLYLQTYREPCGEQPGRRVAPGRPGGGGADQGPGPPPGPATRQLALRHGAPASVCDLRRRSNDQVGYKFCGERVVPTFSEKVKNIR